MHLCGLLAVAMCLAMAQNGTGVFPPRPVHRVSATYSSEAQRAHVQGTVVLEVVVSTEGAPEKIEVISSVGFGLDKQAREAVRQWRFEPGQIDGRSARASTTIEITFRLPNTYFDYQAEHDRTLYNIALHDLAKGDSASAVPTIARLANDRFPPAMYLDGMWLREGKLVHRDLSQSWQLLNAAAEKNYPAAVYEVGRRELETGDDSETGLTWIHDAAVMGSIQAQFYLGSLYETGGSVPCDAERARHYFRQCATAGEASCQLRLARMLLADPARQEDDLLEAIRLLETAAAKLPSAQALLNEYRPQLSLK